MSYKKELLAGKTKINDLISRQTIMWPNIVPIQGEVPANSTSSFFKKSIGNSGHFVCDIITGNFETIELVEGVPVDTGRCLLKLKISDLSNQKALFDDWLSADLFLTPGRAKGLPAVSAYPNQLFFPINFSYIFTVNSDIGVEFSNSSTYACKFNIAFIGLRHRDKA